MKSRKKVPLYQHLARWFKSHSNSKDSQEELKKYLDYLDCTNCSKDIRKYLKSV